MVTQFTEQDPGDLHTLLNEAMARTMAEMKSLQNVANFAALPTADNWPGRLLQTRDTDALYKWSGAAWQLIYAPPSAWTDLSLSAGLVPLSGSVQYRKMNNRVELRGTVTTTGGTADIQPAKVAGTLPVGFRPPQFSRYYTASSGATNTGRRVNVNTLGVISLNESGGGNVAWHSLDGIYFDAAA